MLPLPALVLAVALTPAKMPITGLIPAIPTADLCAYRYPVSTRSADCQRYVDQGLGYYYSYVWMEAARSFETALTHDENCAAAWLGLHRALDKWGKTATPKAEAFWALGGALTQERVKLPPRFTMSPRDFALDRAKALMPAVSHREQLLVRAKLFEKGLMPNTSADERRRKAQQTLDELITLYEDDEEGWFARAQLGDGPHGGTPYYKALLRVNPLHPGANHELVHFYENIKRPALGWPYAEKYMASSPGLPHAFHMQAHLAMRVGKWANTTNWSVKAIEMQRAYHRNLGVRPEDDHQFYHHLETLTRSLLHDGRFAEARAVKAEAEGYKYHFRPEWFRLAVAAKDWAAAEEIVAHFRKSDKAAAAFYGACLALERGDAGRARAEVDALRQLEQKKRGGKAQELRLLEVQGRLECLTGNGPAGVKLLRRAVEKTKDDFAHHAWGNGAYYMEAWGTAALGAGLAADAEEAFQEALAHDAGCAKAALGLWALCERLGRADEAGRYLALARKCWARADSRLFETAKGDALARSAAVTAVAAVAGR